MPILKDHLNRINEIKSNVVPRALEFLKTKTPNKRIYFEVVYSLSFPFRKRQNVLEYKFVH